MNKTILTEMFKKSIESNRKEIIDLQVEYLALKILDECVQDQFKQSSEKVLSEHEFYIDSKWFGSDNTYLLEYLESLNGNNRILKDDNAYLMSEDDFDIYLKLCAAENYKRGLTDEKGYYTEGMNTSKELACLKDKIVRYSVELLPDIPERETLRKAITPGFTYSYKTWESLFDMFMNLDV